MPEDRRLDYMPLTEVARAHRNPKKHDSVGIARSMDEFGVVEIPALDERTGRLVAGHGRLDVWLAAAAKQQQPPSGVKVGPDGVWLVPVLRGWASKDDAHAEAYLVGSNQLTINGGWDDPGLAKLLDDLAAEDNSLLRVTGFDDDQLDKLLSSTDTLGDPAGGFLKDMASQPFGQTVEQQPPPQGPPDYDWPPPPQTYTPGEPDGGGDEEGPVGPQLPPEFPPTAYGPAGTAAQYAPVSWVLHADARTRLRAVLRHLQKTRELATSAEAVNALVDDYITAHNITIEQAEEQPA